MSCSLNPKSALKFCLCFSLSLLSAPSLVFLIPLQFLIFFLQYHYECTYLSYCHTYCLSVLVMNAYITASDMLFNPNPFSTSLIFTQKCLAFFICTVLTPAFTKFSMFKIIFYIKENIFITEFLFHLRSHLLVYWLCFLYSLSSLRT